MAKGWKYILLVSVAIFAVAFTFPTMAQAANTVKVGIVLPLTGSQAAFGEIEKQSFDLAR